MAELIAAPKKEEMQEFWLRAEVLPVVLSAFMLPYPVGEVEVNLPVVPLGVLGTIVHMGRVLVWVFLQELWELAEMQPSMVVEEEEVITVVEEAVGRLVEEEDPVIVLDLLALVSRLLQGFRTVTVM
jgi:hypothetical protein